MIITSKNDSRWTTLLHTVPVGNIDDKIDSVPVSPIQIFESQIQDGQKLDEVIIIHNEISNDTETAVNVARKFIEENHSGCKIKTQIVKADKKKRHRFDVQIRDGAVTIWRSGKELLIDTIDLISDF